MISIKNLFIISFAFIVCTTAHPHKDHDIYKHCYKPCTLIYAPVCGFDGNIHQKFSSECLMEVENCILQVQKSNVFMNTPLYMCEERECNRKCTKEYDPICAFDNNTYKVFSNKCLFNLENCLTDNKWHRVRSDQCSENKDLNKKPEKTCNEICTLQYDPVCGTDGTRTITYGNRCAFEAANCHANYHLRLLRSGEC